MTKTVEQLEKEIEVLKGRILILESLKTVIHEIHHHNYPAPQQIQTPNLPYYQNPVWCGTC